MQILLVDDEPLSRDALDSFLTEQLGHQVTSCDNGESAYSAYLEHNFPIVITDIRMPGMSGLQLLDKINPHQSLTKVILISGHGDIETVIEALRGGAHDFLPKPIEVEDLADSLDRAIEAISLSRSKKKDDSSEDVVGEDVQINVSGVGEIGIFSETMRMIFQITQKFHEDRGVPVLIEGETGTGKEVIARHVHGGQESSRPFISINCAAISPSLFESELFGYEGGSFSGALQSGRIGKFEMAQGGTLFLDEIGELPMDLQPKLLRVLQEKEMYRVGGTRNIPLDVRIVCATNRSLENTVQLGKFRQDLLFRLNLGKIYVPPLRKRSEEIVPLAQMFVVHYAKQKKRRFRFLHREAAQILENYDWPGNIRELQNTIERVVLLYDNIEVLPEHLSFLTMQDQNNIQYGVPIQPGSLLLPSDGLDLPALEGEIIRKALLINNNNQSKTAEYLGITRSVLRSKIKKGSRQI